MRFERTPLALSYFQSKINDVSTYFRPKPRVGVLAIQGSVQEHYEMLHTLGARPLLVKTVSDLEKVNGLIIPGGESTTMGKLLKKYGLDRAIKRRAALGSTSHRRDAPLVLWGTCAGAILLAKKVLNRAPDSLDLMDIAIERNAYGRQMDSFKTSIAIPSLGKKLMPAFFIRAPRIKKTSPRVKILAEYGGTPVMVEQGNLLATMFHPELTQDTRVHRYFLSRISHYVSQ